MALTKSTNAWFMIDFILGRMPSFVPNKVFVVMVRRWGSVFVLIYPFSILVIISSLASMYWGQWSKRWGIVSSSRPQGHVGVSTYPYLNSSLFRCVNPLFLATISSLIENISLSPHGKRLYRPDTMARISPSSRNMIICVAVHLTPTCTFSLLLLL